MPNLERKPPTIVVEEREPERPEGQGEPRTNKRMTRRKFLWWLAGGIGIVAVAAVAGPAIFEQPDEASIPEPKSIGPPKPDSQPGSQAIEPKIEVVPSVLEKPIILVKSSKAQIVLVPADVPKIAQKVEEKAKEGEMPVTVLEIDQQEKVLELAGKVAHAPFFQARVITSPEDSPERRKNWDNVVALVQVNPANAAVLSQDFRNLLPEVPLEEKEVRLAVLEQTRLLIAAVSSSEVNPYSASFTDWSTEMLNWQQDQFEQENKSHPEPQPKAEPQKEEVKTKTEEKTEPSNPTPEVKVKEKEEAEEAVFAPGFLIGVSGESSIALNALGAWLMITKGEKIDYRVTVLSVENFGPKGQKVVFGLRDKFLKSLGLTQVTIYGIPVIPFEKGVELELVTTFSSLSSLISH